MTKDEIIAALEKAGVEFDETASKANLQALLDDSVPEKSKGDEEEGADESDDEETDIEEDDIPPTDIKVDSTAPTGKGVHVFDHNGAYVRTYHDSDLKGTDYKNAITAAKSICEKKVGWTFKEVK